MLTKLQEFWTWIITSRWLCGRGMHDWNLPGGHCRICGACDEFFGEHADCRAFDAKYRKETKP